ncbi:MAG: metal ABC transporter ATP-binding protein [Solirubrobacteraceae bacterium]
MAAQPSQSSIPDATSASLELEGVSLTLGGRTILDNVSFRLEPGELTGLIGSNGAGKTTLMRVVLGLQTPTSGQVRVPRDGRRPSIGYVPQKFLLDPDMPVRARDLVGLGIDGHRLGLSRPSEAREARIDQALAAVDALQFAEHRIGRLSGGQQQRIMIAHALVSQPRLLLLDEPLANLDLHSARDVVNVLARVAHEQHVAVLVSAHEMNALLPVMDRVVYLADGRAASGPIGDVVRSDVLSHLYGHHVDVIHVHGRVVVVAGETEVEPEFGAHADHGDVEVD